jgi:transposase-like protein
MALERGIFTWKCNWCGKQFSKDTKQELERYKVKE